MTASGRITPRLPVGAALLAVAAVVLGAPPTSAADAQHRYVVGVSGMA